MNKHFKYKNLHDYLDEVFSNIEHSTNQQIKEAKRAYWKKYYRHYRREKRKSRKEYTLGFNVDHLTQIQQRKGDLSVSEFLYEVIEKAINVNEDMPLHYDKKLLGKIDQHLMSLIDLIEDWMESQETSNIEMKILERIEMIEEQFSKVFKPHDK